MLSPVSYASLLLPSRAPNPTASVIELIKDHDLSVWRQPTNLWSIVGDVFLSPDNPKALSSKPGTGILFNGGRTSDIVSKQEFGDIELHLEFIISKRSNSGVYFMGSYELQIYDSFGVAKDAYPGIECGGLYPRWINEKDVEGHSPNVNASLPPGQWQTFDVIFRAPRFNDKGEKIANAVFVKVVHNGKVIHEHVELNGETRGGFPERPMGPLRLQGDHGPVAFRNIRIRPVAVEEEVTHSQNYYWRPMHMLKRTIIIIFVGFAACLLTVPQSSRSQVPGSTPNWHENVFFGIHYDLHAKAKDTELGRELTPEHLRERLLRTRPDWVQTDCKGHHGYTSWPTSVGSTSPGVVKDSLRIYRDVTRELGIKLGVHYSGVWD